MSFLNYFQDPASYCVWVLDRLKRPPDFTPPPSTHRGSDDPPDFPTPANPVDLGSTDVDSVEASSHILGLGEMSSAPSDVSLEDFVRHVLQYAPTPARPTDASSGPTLGGHAEAQSSPLGATYSSSPSEISLEGFMRHIVSHNSKLAGPSFTPVGIWNSRDAEKGKKHRNSGHAHQFRVIDQTVGRQVALMRYLSRTDISELAEGDIYQAFRRSIAVLQDGHPESARLMVMHASYLSSLSKLSGSIVYLQEAIALYKRALKLTPKDDPERLIPLGLLVCCLHQLVLSSGSLTDLDDLIQAQRKILEALPASHMERPPSLRHLLKYLIHRIHMTHSAIDIAEAAYLRLDIVRATKIEDPSYSLYLRYFAADISIRRPAEDQLAFIDLLRTALVLWDNEDVGRTRIKAALADWLAFRYDRLEEERDALEAVCLYREAKERLRGGHPTTLSVVLINFANHFTNDFQRTGNKAALSEALGLRRETLQICPPEIRRTALTYLATNLLDSFRLGGRMEHLTDAVDRLREARRFPVNSDGEIIQSDLAPALLASCLELRYDTTGETCDLEESAGLHREALSLFPEPGERRAGLMCNLAGCHGKLFQASKDDRHLIKALDTLKKALLVAPRDSIERGAILSNLADMSNLTTTQTGYDKADIIRHRKEALRLIPRKHHNRPMVLTHLANTLAVHRDEEDLAESMALYTEALELCPEGHPYRAEILLHKARSLIDRLCLDIDQRDSHTVSSQEGSHYTEGDTLSDILDAARLVSASTTGSVHTRLWGAMMWLRLARTLGPQSEALEAASAVIQAFDLSVVRAGSLEDQYRGISKGDGLPSGLALSAAAAALECNDLLQAVTLLEQGRAVIFKQLSRYRAVFDEISDKSPELAKRARRLGRQLDGLVAGGIRIRPEGTSLWDQDDPTTRYHQASMEWNATVDEIRTLPGCESFLRPPDYDQLKQAAEGGPVIIINVEGYHSDAIIVLFKADPIWVPLPLARAETIRHLADRLGDRPATLGDDEMMKILQELWRIIVAPVVSQLAHTVQLPAGSRIWWCPTGAASRLPLHAAGPYSHEEKNLPHVYVSSYTPTLGALIQARKPKITTSDAGIPSLLVVSQPATPGQNPLRSAAKESQSIRCHAPSAVEMIGALGTCEAVVAGLKTHSWAHFACHGHHDSTNPFLSNFSLHDGPLSLRTIIQHELPHADLAYLSACHSAKGSAVSPDEALHLAAGMMFVGYRGVVGTMWALDDDIGCMVAEEYYRLMLGHKGGPKDSTKAAIVLAKAVERLPEWVPLSQRVNFVHFGI